MKTGWILCFFEHLKLRWQRIFLCSPHKRGWCDCWVDFFNKVHSSLYFPFEYSISSSPKKIVLSTRLIRSKKGSCNSIHMWISMSSEIMERQRNHCVWIAWFLLEKDESTRFCFYLCRLPFLVELALFPFEIYKRFWDHRKTLLSPLWLTWKCIFTFELEKGR